MPKNSTTCQDKKLGTVILINNEVPASSSPNAGSEIWFKHTHLIYDHKCQLNRDCHRRQLKKIIRKTRKRPRNNIKLIIMVRRKSESTYYGGWCLLNKVTMTS